MHIDEHLHVSMHESSLSIPGPLSGHRLPRNQQKHIIKWERKQKSGINNVADDKPERLEKKQVMKCG